MASFVFFILVATTKRTHFNRFQMLCAFARKLFEFVFEEKLLPIVIFQYFHLSEIVIRQMRNLSV